MYIIGIICFFIEKSNIFQNKYLIHAVIRNCLIKTVSYNFFTYFCLILLVLFFLAWILIYLGNWNFLTFSKISANTKSGESWYKIKDIGCI